MPMSSSEYVTLCYDNYPDQREFVFSMKGRPFAMLSTQKLPVPTTSLIDFNLVSELGLKMSDLQCSKFSYGGQKFRVLGKISQTVQTITNGMISGTVHMRASVVEGLRTVFDSHGIAGKKFSELLTRKVSHTTPTASPKPSTPSSTRSRGSKSPTATTPSTTRSSKGPAADAPKISGPSMTRSSTPSSPPGFPSVPQYHRPDVTCTEPDVPMNKPPPGYVRTLQLKPVKSRNKSWHQGRVVEIRREGRACVEVIWPDGSLYAAYCKFPWLELEVNDVVLFHDRDLSSDDEAQIYVVYNEEEVDQLKARGVEIPDLPPEMFPNGYYG